MSDHSADPSRIEHDLAETRARLAGHLDELTRRLSPGQLLDEGLAYLRDGQGAVFARNLGSDVRDNPLPVALTGLGLAWLAIASGTSHRTNGSASRALVPYDRARAEAAERARRAGDALTRGAEETEEAFRSRVAEARAQILGVQRQVSETAAAFAERVQQTLEQVQSDARAWANDIAERGQHAADAIGEAAERGRAMAARAGSGLADTISENPLLLGALGVTAGMLLGALLPKTEQEDAMLRPATRQAADAVRNAGEEVMERGRRAADAAASAAYRAANE